MKRMYARMKAWMMDYAYLVTLGALIAVVVGSALYTQQVRREREAGVQAAAHAPEIEQTATPTPAVTPLPTIAPLAVRPVLLTGSAQWPVDGDVLRSFDAQTSVYWARLQSWRVHAGLDIAGEAGQRVDCAAEGRVTGVTWDELWGWRVTVDQSDGRQTAYAGLESAVVAVGERVTRGQTIGTLLAQVPCEAELPAHLHMEVTRDGEPQDPEAMLPER